MAVSLTRDRVGQCRNAAGMPRSASAGKPRHGEIEAAPEEMHRAHFAKISGTKALEDLVNGHEGLKKVRDRSGRIGPLGAILHKRDRIGNFVGPPVKVRGTAERTDQIAKALVKLGDRHRGEREPRRSPVCS